MITPTIRDGAMMPRKKIFVVEDDADIAVLIRHTLERAGFHVDAYSSAESVISDEAQL